MNNRLEVLDSIRGLAAFVVVIYHFTYRYYEIYPQNNQLLFSFYEGKYGVQTFFILSGFVIFMTLSRIEKPIDFIISRFSRLYPVFWFCVIFSFTIISIFGLYGREVTFSQMIINFSMIPSVFNTPSVDGVYWTLLYELKFYFWIFIIYSLGFIKKIDKLILIYILLGFCFHFFVNQESIFGKILLKLFVFDYLSYFISGIIFYKIYNNERTKILMLTLILCFLFSQITNTYENGLVTLSIIYLIFLVFSFGKLDWFSNKFLTYLGTISYSLYLIHQNIGYILLNYFNLIKIEPLISLILSIFIVMILSTLISLFIEKRSTNYLKIKYKKNKKIISDKLKIFSFTKFLTKEMK